MTIFLYNNTNKDLFNNHINNKKIYKTKNYIINSLFWGFKKTNNFRTNRKIFNNMDLKKQNYLLLINDEKYYLFQIIGKINSLTTSEEKFDHCYILENVFLELNNDFIKEQKFFDLKKDVFINITKKYKFSISDLTRESIIENKINKMDDTIHKLNSENKYMKSKLSNVILSNEKKDNDKSMLLKINKKLESNNSDLLQKIKELQEIMKNYHFYKEYYDNYNVIVEDDEIEEDEFDFVKI